MVFNTVVFDTVVFNTVALYYPLNLIEPDYLFFSFYFCLFLSVLFLFSLCIFSQLYLFTYLFILLRFDMQNGCDLPHSFLYLFSQFLWIQSMCCLQKILANLNRRFWLCCYSSWKSSSIKQNFYGCGKSWSYLKMVIL